MGLVVISYDTPAVLKKFSDRSHISFPMLSDADSAVIRRYGILNDTVPKNSAFYGVPFPGTYVLDKNGVVVDKYFQEDYRVRDTASSMLLRTFGVRPQEAVTVTGKHATLRTSVTGTDLRPGQRVTLTVEVILPKGVHVYAPGVEGYKPVVLTLNDTKGYAGEAAVFPASKVLRLKAIKETVPVFEKQFRVMQTVTLANAQLIEPLLDKDRQLTVEAAFAYQACDDHECYLPETVPLKWVVKVTPFDQVRVAPELRRQANPQ